MSLKSLRYRMRKLRHRFHLLGVARQSALQNHHGHGDVPSVGQAKMCPSGTQPGGPLGGAAVKKKLRALPGSSNHFNLLPAYTATNPGSQRFCTGFFSRKPSGEALRRRLDLPLAVRNLRRSEDSFLKTRTEALQRSRHPCNLHQVGSSAHNHPLHSLAEPITTLPVPCKFDTPSSCPPGRRYLLCESTRTIRRTGHFCSTSDEPHRPAGLLLSRAFNPT